MASIPAVKALEATYWARGLRVVSVTGVTRPTRMRWLRCLERSRARDGLPRLLDEDSAWMSRVGIPAVPAFLVIVPKGS